MRIICFNVQRWGASTTPERRQAFEARFAAIQPDMVLYTEISTACVDPVPFNPTYRRPNPAQLCYAGKYRTAAGPANVTFRRLEADEVAVTPAYAALYPGAKKLDALVDRAPALVTTDTGDVPVVLLHAPASEEATRAVIMVACWLEANCGEYLLLGDLNSTPGTIKETVKRTAASFIANRMRYTMSGTHHGKRGSPSNRYDFVIAKRKGDKATSIEPVMSGLAYASSDHCPVVIDTSA